MSLLGAVLFQLLDKVNLFLIYKLDVLEAMSEVTELSCCFSVLVLNNLTKSALNLPPEITYRKKFIP